MEEIEKNIHECSKCDLYKDAKNAVPGSGNYNSKIVFIGEAPGKNEDKQGEPFVGRAGGILDELLEGIGLEREDVYISNIVKHRPPENRDPTDEEIEACSPYLDKQIDLLKPEVLAPLGRFSMEYILDKYNLGSGKKISNIHGQKFEVSTLFGGMKIMPMYHPAVALYQRSKIETLEEDFEALKEIIE